jgi:hypothetical protein
MSVRICGHLLRVEKTIKPFTFFRNAAALLVLSVILITPVHAADNKYQASSADRLPCLSPNTADMDNKAPLQAQRTAGSPSAAMVLAMALGLRNISGPMEQAKQTQPSAPDRQALLTDGAKKCLTQKSGASRIAMER